MSDGETAAVLSLISGLLTSNVSALVRHPLCSRSLNVYSF
jgi:hypothetical protein